MTPEEYQPLNRLYDDVAALCARFERRHEQTVTHPSDHTLNKTAFRALDDIRERLLDYVEASAPFFTEGEPYRDEDGVRLDDSDDRSEYVQMLVNDLRHLSESTLNRVSTAPGSTARLSHLFAGTIRRERGEILELANRLSLLVQREQAVAQHIRSEDKIIVVNFSSKRTAPVLPLFKPA